MNNEKKLVLAFLANEIPPKQFLKLCREYPSILEWVQSIVPDEMTCYKNGVKTYPNGYAEHYSELVPYDIKLVFDQYMSYGRPGDTLDKCYNLHCSLSKLLTAALPEENIVISSALNDQLDFMLTACPEYIGGDEPEVDEFIERLYEELPKGLSKTARRALFREQIKELFHLEGKKYPHWIQSPEWPMGKHSPMKFIKQKAQGEQMAYLFQDVDTGEIREIVQYY